jgi:exonuclease III
MAKGLSWSSSGFTWYPYRHNWGDNQFKYGMRLDYIFGKGKGIFAKSSTLLIHYRFGVEKTSDHVPVESIYEIFT